jgi:hypothetical protein
MKWKRIVRASGLVEWQCEHGVGHPDVNSVDRMGDAWGIHGCDGCCGRDDFPGERVIHKPGGERR